MLPEDALFAERIDSDKLGLREGSSRALSRFMYLRTLNPKP